MPRTPLSLTQVWCQPTLGLASDSSLGEVVATQGPEVPRSELRPLRSGIQLFLKEGKLRLNSGPHWITCSKMVTGVTV